MVLGMQLAVSATLCICSVDCRTVITGVTLAHSCKLVDRVEDVGKKWRFLFLASMKRLPILKE